MILLLPPLWAQRDCGWMQPAASCLSPVLLPFHAHSAPAGSAAMHFPRGRVTSCIGLSQGTHITPELAESIPGRCSARLPLAEDVWPSRQKPPMRTSRNWSAGSGNCRAKPVSIQASPHVQRFTEQLAPACTQRPRTTSTLQIPHCLCSVTSWSIFCTSCLREGVLLLLSEKSSNLMKNTLGFGFFFEEFSRFMLMSEHNVKHLSR